MSRVSPAGTCSSRVAVAMVLLGVLALGLLASPAWAGRGYELDSSQPTITLDAEVPTGVAIDQSSQTIYVAEVSKSLLDLASGEVEQLDSSGVATANSPFQTGGQDFFVAVAVNPLNHGIYAYQVAGNTPAGLKGESLLSVFSAAGAAGATFSATQSAAGTMAVDSSGLLYFPSGGADAVQVFNSAGTLEKTISCGGCPGGAFDEPNGVAFDSTGRLYVVERGSGSVVRLAPSGGGYVYESTLQNERGAVAVAVDPSDDDVFVGDLVSGKYHVVAYDSTGTEFDDFGAGLVSPSLIEVATGQLAASLTSHRVYLSNPGGRQLWVFEPVASIPAPAADIVSPSQVGQAEATLRASVEPKEHVLTSCHFEYTNHADFLASGYANAKSAACPAVVGGTGSIAVSSAVTGLTPGTEYDYRIQVVDHGGSAEAGPESFETLPALPPEASTGTATSITKTGATLGGSVNPKGGKISNCHFEFITEAAFEKGGFNGASSKACSMTPRGDTVSPVSAVVGGLSVGTAYRFRVVATNNTGTTQASPSGFATTAETCATNPAFCPPSENPPAPPAPASPLPGLPAPIAPKPKPLECRKGFKKKRVRGKLRCVRAKKKHRTKR